MTDDETLELLALNVGSQLAAAAAAVDRARTLVVADAARPVGERRLRAETIALLGEALADAGTIWGNLGSDLQALTPHLTPIEF